MRRITLWLLSTVAALVLLFSYRTSTNSGAGTAIAGASTGGTTSTGSGAISTGSGTTSTGGGATPASGASSAAASGGASSGSRTYQGSVTQTRYGPIQVTITVSNGKIANVSVPTYPNNSGRDQEINAYALPILTQETLTAQSAQIDMVSGATYTSDGYIQSLQAAIDAAHL